MTFHQKVWRPEDSGMNDAFTELKSTNRNCESRILYTTTYPKSI